MILPTDLFAFENLWRQYRICRRNKRNTINQLRFELDAEAQLLTLQHELRAHTYQPRQSICFVTDGPKPREVFAADFRDRIVHHVLVSRLEPVFEPAFIHDSYACRKEKGVLAASNRLMAFLRRVTANGQRRAWALNLDVASFFPSIDKQTLYAIIARRVRDPELHWLTRIILFHDPTIDYRFKRGPGHTPPPGSGRYPVPEQKSLFGTGNERGLPIGNLTSQFWANVYLNELDHFVKRTLRCQYYVRYVDDLVLLDTDAERLRQWRDAIAAYGEERLKLRLRDRDALPQPTGRGIDFVGWNTFWNHRRPRGRTLASCEARVTRFARRELQPLWGGAALRLDGERHPEAVPALRATLASYSGHLRHGAAYQKWLALWERHGWLRAFFTRQQHDPWRVHARWPERRLGGPRFSSQYGRLIRHAGHDALVFCQVGRFVEFYGPQRRLAARALRLVRVGIARGGFAFSVGLPVRLSGAYIARAVRAGFAVAEVREVERLHRTCAARQVVAVWIPVAWAWAGASPSVRRRPRLPKRLAPPEEHHKERKKIESDPRSR
jgi:RNA-directed DNA polymerase